MLKRQYQYEGNTIFVAKLIMCQDHYGLYERVMMNVPDFNMQGLRLREINEKCDLLRYRSNSARSRTSLSKCELAAQGAAQEFWRPAATCAATCAASFASTCAASCAASCAADQFWSNFSSSVDQNVDQDIDRQEEKSMKINQHIYCTRKCSSSKKN